MTRYGVALGLALLSTASSAVAESAYYYRSNPGRSGVAPTLPGGTDPTPDPVGTDGPAQPPAPLSATGSGTPVVSVLDAVQVAILPTGGKAPYSFTRLSGRFPAGVELGADGTVSGQASGTPGLYDSVVRVTDAAGAIKDVPVRIEVRTPAPVVSEPTIPPATVGSPFSFPVETANGTTVAWSVTDLGNADWLAPAGSRISGTPTVAGAASFLVVGTDAFGRQSATGRLGVEVADPLSARTAAIPTATVGQRLAFSLDASGGRGAHTWTLAEGALPQGGVSAVNGVLQGTVSGPVSGVRFRVTDADGRTDVTPVLSMAANPAPALSGAVSPPSASVRPNGAVAFSGPTATGGTAPVAFELASGSFPTGVDLNPTTGAVTGSVQGSGSWSFALRLRDANGIVSAASAPVSVDAYAKLSIAADRGLAAEGSVGTEIVPVSYTISGGTPAARLALTGNVPPGLSIEGNRLVGAPTLAGTYAFSVTATDTAASPDTASVAHTLTVLSRLAIAAATPVPTVGTIGRALGSTTFQATGGKGPYTYEVSGNLPPNVTLVGNVLSGTPTTAGEYVFTVDARDASQASVRVSTEAYRIVVAAPVSASFSTLPDGVVNGTYATFTAAATGGLAPYTWTQSGTLPNGLQWDGSNARIHGTPTVAGTFSGITLTATDAAGRTVTVANLGIVVTDPSANFARPDSLRVLTPSEWTAGYSDANGLAALYDANDATAVTVTPRLPGDEMVVYTWNVAVAPTCVNLRVLNTQAGGSQNIRLTRWSGPDATGTKLGTKSYPASGGIVLGISNDPLSGSPRSVSLGNDDGGVPIKVMQLVVGKRVSGACVSQ